MSNSSIWLIDRTLPGATAPDESVPRSNSIKGVFHIPQSFKTGASRLMLCERIIRPAPLGQPDHSNQI